MQLVSDPDGEIEYGLKLPNGQVCWSIALGSPITTNEERATMVAILGKTGEQCGWPAEEFINHYKWVERQVIALPGEYALGSASQTDLNQ